MRIALTVCSPGQQNAIVGHQDESTKYRSHTNTTITGMHLSKNTNMTDLVGLSERDLEDQNRKANENESHEVGNEKGTASKVFGKLRETPHITKPNCTSDSCEVKANTRVPALATAGLFFRLVSKGTTSGGRNCRHDESSSKNRGQR